MHTYSSKQVETLDDNPIVKLHKTSGHGKRSIGMCSAYCLFNGKKMLPHLKPFQKKSNNLDSVFFAYI
jgi:hypothetical protein